MSLLLKRCRVARFVLLLLLVSVSFAASTYAQANRRGRITAMKVSTVESTEGKISVSDDVFANQQGNRPVFAGIGAANYPEHYLLVLVQVTGGDLPKVDLRATEGRRVVWSKVSSAFYEKLGADREDLNNPRRYAIFFIEGERCTTLRLTARLVGPGRQSSLTKAIEFACGE